MSNFLVFIIGFLVLIQGGFFLRTSLLALMMLLVALFYQCIRKKRKLNWNQNDTIVLVLCCGVVMCYVLSGICHGFSETIINRCVLFIGIFVGKLYGKIMNENEIYKFVSGMLWIGLAQWLCLVITMYGGKMPLADIIVNHRFMGTFQYANATGIWLVMLLLAAEGMRAYKTISRHGDIITMLLTITLSFTLSVGSIICYLIFLALVPTADRKSNAFVERYARAIIGLLFGLITYVVHYRFQSFVGSAAVMLLAIFFPFLFFRFQGWCKKSWYLLALIFFLLVGGGVAIHLVGNRAIGTFMERLVQMRDGIEVICSNIATGIGSEPFSSYVAENRVPSYHVSLVHNSFIQMGVEAGIGALAFMVLYIIHEMVMILKSDNKRKMSCLSIFGAMCLHSCFDFSFFFFSIVFFCMLLSVKQ